MGRQGKRAPQFAPHMEPLEERRVMSADPVAGLLGGVEHQAEEESPQSLAAVAALQSSGESFGQAIFSQDLLEAPLAEHQGLTDADFWADPANQVDLDDYLRGIEQALTEAHNQTGWFNVRNNYGFTGRGQTVAVIDSGIAWDHFALGGGLGKDYRVVGGWDFTEESDANPYDDGTAGGHGSHVSGIIGSTSTTNPGVASGVDFVGLRVFNDAGSGYFNWVENALRWIHENRNSFENPITTVNLSLGVSTWNAATIPLWATLEDEFAQLAADGIFIAVAAGNYYQSYNAPGLSYPASSPNVVPVMSTDDNSVLSYFSQRLGRAIAAPGRSITSTVPDYKGNKNGIADDYATMSGTSMAAPYVAGASVLVREAMQFIGRTNITQAMIYDHLMATADTLFDAASNLSYKRLNLSRAIDSLMPADDFGSTMGSAFNLGTVVGGSTSGAIAKLGDVDYFTFTAGVTGTATFNATNLQQSMTPKWQVYGATPLAAAAAGSNALSFAVTAGKSYTVSLASLGGLGHYTFDVTTKADEAFSFTDWGAVAYNQRDDVAVNGAAWYRVQATRDGVLTVQGTFSAAGGAVKLELYDANQRLVAAGTTTGNVARVDVTAAAGTEFYVRVSGANSDVDFKLVNLVSQNGSVVTAFGTSGDDSIVFNAGTAPVLAINGVSYGFAAGSARQFNVDAGAGNDVITVYGTAGADAATFRPGAISFTGGGATLDAIGVDAIYAHGCGGVDTATFFDSIGDDRLISRQTYTTMNGEGYSHYASGFANVYAYSMAGGNDTSELYDSAGDDAFRGKPTVSTLTGVGYFRYMYKFENVYAYSVAGGLDKAELYDSPDDDALTMRSDYSSLRNSTTFNLVRGFDQVFAYSMYGGRDTASMYDSAGDDEFIARPTYSLMRGNGFYNQAKGFASVKAYATAGGTDASWLYGSAGDETFTMRGDQASLVGASVTLCSQGFARTKVAGMGGNDSARIHDLANEDSIYGVANLARVTRSGRTTQVENFSRVAAVIAGAVTPTIDVKAVDYLFEVL